MNRSLPYRAKATLSTPREEDSRNVDVRIVEWLNQNPAPSTAGCCAWCGRLETPEAMLLPFGTEPGSRSLVENRIKTIEVLDKDRNGNCVHRNRHGILPFMDDSVRR